MSKCRLCKKEIIEGDETLGTGARVIHKACSEGDMTKESVEFKYTSYPSGLPNTYKEDKEE